GHTVQFCRDQHGSRFIQQKLEVASEAEKAAFFEEVVPHAQSLMTDVFGNYVIQKLFDHGGPDQRENLASFLVGHAVQLSLQMYGCRVVQKALEFASIDTLIALVSEFSGQVMKCVQDQNGNHVIQKCIEVVCATAKAEGAYLHSHIQFIIDAFMGQVEKLSTHAYGCRVIQRILEHCIDAQRDPVLEEIRNSFSALIQDQYGNYVIQHVLKHGRPSDRVMLMNEVRVHLLPYSQHKFASNVVEKCLQYGTREERGALIHHLTHGHAEGQASLLQVMVCDPYANYVVQKIIDVADAEQREGIITEIRAHAAQLKRYTFGKHIISRLEKISGKKM
ncbi:armadillo-type protein, partial [Tribonema minus]